MSAVSLPKSKSPRPSSRERSFITEDELRAVLRRCHDLVYMQYAKDPAAAFDVTCLILAAKLSAEAGLGQWPSPAEAPEDKAATLQAALRGADQRLSGADQASSPTPIPTPHFADELVSLFDGLSLRSAIQEDGDLLGTAYQAIVGATFRGELGAYFTPPGIASFMAAMVNLKRGRVADPASGTGTLLLAAEQHGDAVKGFGNDINPRMARAARLNYALRGKPADRILNGDGLELERMLKDWPLDGFRGERIPQGEWVSRGPGPFDAVFANPPFAGHETNPETLQFSRAARTPAGRTIGVPRTLPFLEVILAMLAEGGTGAVVIPTSVLNAEADAFRRFRATLMQTAEITAVIGLPEAAFVYTDCGIHGALLFFRRTAVPRPDYPVFVDWVDNVGYDRLGRPMSGSDFETVAARYHCGEWDPENLFHLSELLAADRFDPNWLRHARSEPVLAGSVPLTKHFTVRNARISTRDLTPEREFRCFEVADADMATGAVTATRILRGDAVKAKSRLRLQVRAGDVLLPNHRDSLIARGAPSGRSAVVVPPELDGAITSNRFLVLRTDLAHGAARAVLNAAGVRRQLVAMCRGAASLDVREKSLDSVLLPPNLVSPAALNAVTESATRVEKLRAEYEAALRELRDLVQAPFGDDSDFRPQSRQVM